MTGPTVVLSIAGTDSGGGAGLAADLTTFAALGVHGTCAVTTVTAQDTLGVQRMRALSVVDVRAQIAAVLDDLPVAAVKTGLLGYAEAAGVVAELVHGPPLVVDPVLTTTTGFSFGGAELVAAYREVLLPAATVVTPNLDEALALTGLDRRTPPREVAAAVHALGPAVVLTGGDPATKICTDVLVDRHGTTVLEHAAVPTRNDHGTGCTFSAALAVHLAHGLALDVAARRAQAFVAAALTASSPWQLGRGRGPIAHVFTPTHQEKPCT